MTYEAFPSDDFAPFGCGGTSRRLARQAVPIAIALSAMTAAWMVYGRTADTQRLGYQRSALAVSPPPGLRANVGTKTAAPVPPATYGALVAPTFAPGHASLSVAPSFPMSAASEAAAKPPVAPMVVAAVEPSHAVPTLPATAKLAPAAAPEDMTAETSTADIPMPMPRPHFLYERAAPPASAPRRTAQQPPQPSAQPVAPGAPAAAPSFIDRLFGGASETTPRGTALAYATPQDGMLRRNPASRVPTSAPHTAVYDIAARTVYLPDGTQLEAHSGFGDQLDDPRAVTAKMTGPTPPAVYELTLRESLFHGVQALRLTPVRGDTFGRTGLLAHRFMMGARGDSNGCVSVRDYDAFLRAYTSGQIRRLVVVAGLR